MTVCRVQIDKLFKKKKKRRKRRNSLKREIPKIQNIFSWLNAMHYLALQHENCK